MARSPFIAVLDANVLFPLTLRDTLLRAAAAGFYQLRWSADILDEMERNLVSTRTVLADRAARLRATMETYFPEAEVLGSRPRISTLQNHPKDRHVVVAALEAGARVIVTSNLKDFVPLPDGLDAQSPDNFLLDLFESDPAAFAELLREQAGDLVKPPVTFDELLARLDKIVPEFVSAVRAETARSGEATVG